MKIQPSVGPLPVDELRPTRAAASRPAERSDVATFSREAQFVDDLRSEAASESRYGDVRPEVVAQLRDDIRTGALGSPEDLERTLDALLREL